MTHIQQMVKRLALAVSVLALAGALAAPLASATPASEATEWLASQLKSTAEGSACELFGEASVGETIECQLAFKAGAPGFESQRKATYEWVLANKAKYIGSAPCSTATSLSAGAVAKIALAVEAQGEDPRSVGASKRNLIEDLECLQVTSGTEAGRFSDKGTTNFSNVTTQSLAIVALRACEVNCSGKPNLKAWIKPGAAYLRSQQCAGSKPKALDGAFRSEMGLAASTCNSKPPFEPENPNAVEVDSTGTAIQALLQDGTGESAAAAGAAVKWLKSNEAASGAWENYCSFSESTVLFESANSTALAVMAEVEDGVALKKGQTWLNERVEAQPKGERGLPACGKTGAPDVFATSQGILGLFGTSYPRLVGLP
jgi:hypothetical protein